LRNKFGVFATTPLPWLISFSLDEVRRRLSNCRGDHKLRPTVCWKHWGRAILFPASLRALQSAEFGVQLEDQNSSDKIQKGRRSETYRARLELLSSSSVPTVLEDTVTCHLIDEADGPIATQLHHICPDTLPWLISFSLGHYFPNAIEKPPSRIFCRWSRLRRVYGVTRTRCFHVTTSRNAVRKISISDFFPIVTRM
jgi:hypothetical protein